MVVSGFEDESNQRLDVFPSIRDLNLRIEGSSLEPVIAEFGRELSQARIQRLKPRFYLSTEWGVMEGTIAIAIPFYLASPELTRVHIERVGHVEGVGRSDLLRYLRHEMGHVVNYAYQLFESPDWLDIFGSMDRPYLDEFRMEPFSRQFVRHLPGWYAQKHPDEDWAETFAVWMTPDLDWRAEYADWPVALAKLQFCDRTMAAIENQDPPVTENGLDEDVSDIVLTVDDFYRGVAWPDSDPFPNGLDSALREALPGGGLGGPSPASALIRASEGVLIHSIYHWTGHFPERTRPLLRHLADRAEALQLGFSPADETAALIGLTALVTTLALNHTQRGSYLL